MVNVVGDSSSGKTFLAWEILMAAFAAYKKQLKWNYDDSETGNTFDTEKLYGVDLIGHAQSLGFQSDTVEQFDGNVSRFLKEIRSVNQYGIYVEDSLDGLSDADKEKQEKALEKAATTGKEKEGNGSYNTGTASHLSKQFFRTKAGKLDKKKVLLLIISQVRENLNAGPFGKKHYRAGGKAMDFYAHTCLWLYNIKKFKKNGRVVGVLVKAKTEKSKTPRPYRECVFPIYFDYGVDNIGSCLDFLYDLRGDDGELKKTAQSVPWSSTGKAKDWKGIQAWLKEIDEYETAKEIKKEETGKANLSMAWIEEYIESSPKLKKLSKAYFGEGIPRDDLIEQIENSKDMFTELERRVVDKWEDIEESIQTNRKRKYS